MFLGEVSGTLGALRFYHCECRRQLHDDWICFVGIYRIIYVEGGLCAPAVLGNCFAYGLPIRLRVMGWFCGVETAVLGVSLRNCCRGRPLCLPAACDNIWHFEISPFASRGVHLQPPPRSPVWSLLSQLCLCSGLRCFRLSMDTPLRLMGCIVARKQQS